MRHKPGSNTLLVLALPTLPFTTCASGSPRWMLVVGSTGPECLGGTTLASNVALGLSDSSDESQRLSVVVGPLVAERAVLVEPDNAELDRSITDTPDCDRAVP